MKLLDLSHPFYAGMYTGMYDVNKKKIEKSPGMDLEIRNVRTAEEHGVNMLQITFGNHMGTHVDVPLHLIPGGESIDQLPLELFYGTGVVLDIPKGPNGGIGRAELESAEPPVLKGDIVLICTGWSKKFTSSDYPSHHPYLAEDGAHWLVKKGVRMVGIDVLSLDLPHSLREKGFKYTSLRILFENRIPAIHNLTNLEPILERRVMVFSLPINFRGVDGSPARVVAQLE